MKRFIFAAILLLLTASHLFAQKNWKEEINKDLVKIENGKMKIEKGFTIKPLFNTETSSQYDYYSNTKSIVFPTQIKINVSIEAPEKGLLSRDYFVSFSSISVYSNLLQLIFDNFSNTYNNVFLSNYKIEESKSFEKADVNVKIIMLEDSYLVSYSVPLFNIKHSYSETYAEYFSKEEAYKERAKKEELELKERERKQKEEEEYYLKRADSIRKASTEIVKKDLKKMYNFQSVLTINSKKGFSFKYPDSFDRDSYNNECLLSASYSAVLNEDNYGYGGSDLIGLNVIESIDINSFFDEVGIQHSEFITKKIKDNNWNYLMRKEEEYTSEVYYIENNGSNCLVIFSVNNENSELLQVNVDYDKIITNIMESFKFKK